MKKFIFVLITIFGIFMYSCEEKTENASINDNPITKNAETLIKADNEFGFELFKKVDGLEEGREKNIFISPVSVALALAMTYNGADGETKTAMETTLKKEGFVTDDINEIYKDLMEYLKTTDPKILLEIANSIWYKQGFTVEPDFIETNQTYYSAEVSSLDFSDPNAVHIINNWVSEKTHEKIPTIIDVIPPDAVMYLINAIYFKGIWKYEFDKEDTENDYFHLSNEDVVEVEMMQQQEEFNYYVDDLFQAIDLPYGDSSYSMIILLPNNSIDDVIESLDLKNWDQLITNFSRQEIIVRLPKFKFEYKNTLNDELTDMGMGIAFSDIADFSKINPFSPLSISKVIHKSFVEVNEEGTEAAAVTAVEIFIICANCGSDNTINFNVTKPFLFAIKENTSNSIVFIGKVMDPTTE